jgi:succinate dehydrogenase/fumarate reductase flavoprotein subunit
MEGTIAKLTSEENTMAANKKVVIIGCGGAGGPAAILSRKINPELDVTVIRSEPNFIVR